VYSCDSCTDVISVGDVLKQHCSCVGVRDAMPYDVCVFVCCMGDLRQFMSPAGLAHSALQAADLISGCMFITLVQLLHTLAVALACTGTWWDHRHTVLLCA
jgi:hypothetical protein